MSEHTPGHWHASGYAVFAGKNCIAVCDTDNAKPERYDANARLMAAAPDMLDALKAAQGAVEQLCTGQDPDTECWVTLAVVRSAIARAEGRS